MMWVLIGVQIYYGSPEPSDTQAWIDSLWAREADCNQARVYNDIIRVRTKQTAQRWFCREVPVLSTAVPNWQELVK